MKTTYSYKYTYRLKRKTVTLVIKMIVILDTSAIPSGKPLDFTHSKLVTSEGVAQELQPGGKDHRTFQFLQEKGLLICRPTTESMNHVKDAAKQTGDLQRLSNTDIEILALTWEYTQQSEKNVILLSDDYSIQNIAYSLNLHVETISQKGITKKFKWTYLCQGCGKKFKEHIKTCPICGAETKAKLEQSKNLNK